MFPDDEEHVSGEDADSKGDQTSPDPTHNGWKR
jgi:hypothetical protein